MSPDEGSSSGGQPVHPDRWVGAVVGQRYTLTQMLGQGELTWVFAGHCNQSSRPVIVKLLPSPNSLSPDKFLWDVRQAIALSHLEHPAVTPIVDFGPLPGTGAYLVRDATAGQTLREPLLRGRLSERESVSIALQLARALADAHRQSVIHGRLKPENIFVQPSPEGGYAVQVVDFGLTRLGCGTARSSAEAERLHLQTRLYQAPTHDSQEGCTPWDDLYAVGVLLYEMLTGQPPFELNTDQVCGNNRPRPPYFAQFRPTVACSLAVEQIVRQLLEAEFPESQWSAERLVDCLLQAQQQLENGGVQAASPVAAAAAHRHPEDEEVTRAVAAVSPSTLPTEPWSPSQPKTSGRVAAFNPHGGSAVAMGANGGLSPQPLDAQPGRLGMGQPVSLALDTLGPAAHTVQPMAPVALAVDSAPVWPPVSVAGSSLPLSVDLEIPASPRLSFAMKLKRLFRRSRARLED